MRTRQLNLFNEKQSVKYFGGSYISGRRKTMRPLSTKLPMHLILRSKHKQAHKAFSYHLKSNGRILESTAKKFHIKIYRQVFNHTHLHIVIRIPSREAYIGFVRVLTARLSKLTQLKQGELFSLRPFTRILSWGREFKLIESYINKNIIEAIGCIEIAKEEIPIEFRPG